jgi:hypothetical protein
VWYVPPGSLYEDKSMEGGWYFCDETENFGGGPYLTEKEAIEELNKYAAWLNGEVSNEFVRTASENVRSSRKSDS